MIALKITCDTGKTWVTSVSSNIHDAARYFLGAVFVDEAHDGTETRNQCTNIEWIDAPPGTLVKSYSTGQACYRLAQYGKGQPITCQCKTCAAKNQTPEQARAAMDAAHSY